jgi:hypothetical protein
MTTSMPASQCLVGWSRAGRCHPRINHMRLGVRGLDMAEAPGDFERASRREFLFPRLMSEGIGASAAASPVAVRIIRTVEELMIAKMVCRVLGLG